MASKSDEFTNLKTEGNAFFLSGDSAKAAEIYTTLLENYDRERAILFTNRSAARLNLGLIEEALADAEQAIGHDKKWIKAYYRKASSLKLLKRPKDVFDTWMTASDECDSASSPWLLNQIDMARIEWMKIFRDVPVVDDDDFISRYEMLIESREKLSTMAHFWNDSSLAERGHHFRFLIKLIGGESDASMESRSLTDENMPTMPLHNYGDLPRSAILLWCEYYLILSSELKTNLMKRMWETLTSTEQTAVVTDLRQFINLSVEDELRTVVEECRSVQPTIENSSTSISFTS